MLADLLIFVRKAVFEVQCERFNAMKCNPQDFESLLRGALHKHNFLLAAGCFDRDEKPSKHCLCCMHVLVDLLFAHHNTEKLTQPSCTPLHLASACVWQIHHQLCGFVIVIGSLVFMA